MKAIKQNKGVYLFFYLIIGLVVSAVIVSVLEYFFSGYVPFSGKIWIFFILCIALISFFLSQAVQTSLKVAGYILSIVVFTTLILFLYRLFAVEHLFRAYMFFSGAAVAGELMMFVIALLGPSKKFYAGIGAAVCIVVSGLVSWGYMEGRFKTVACIVLFLAYLYFSTLFYFAYDDSDHSKLLEKSGKTFNIVALFFALYGRYTYSWRR